MACISPDEALQWEGVKWGKGGPSKQRSKQAYSTCVVRTRCPPMCTLYSSRSGGNETGSESQGPEIGIYGPVGCCASSSSRRKEGGNLVSPFFRKGNEHACAFRVRTDGGRLNSVYNMRGGGPAVVCLLLRPSSLCVGHARPGCPVCARFLAWNFV